MYPLGTSHAEKTSLPEGPHLSRLIHREVPVCEAVTFYKAMKGFLVSPHSCYDMEDQFIFNQGLSSPSLD